MSRTAPHNKQIRDRGHEVTVGILYTSFDPPALPERFLSIDAFRHRVASLPVIRPQALRAKITVSAPEGEATWRSALCGTGEAVPLI